MSTFVLTPAAQRISHAPAVGASAARARSAPRYRLTSRGRMLVRLVALLAVAATLVLAGSRVAATRTSGHLRTTTVQVQPGDTLWRIAATADPGTDIRDTVDRIVELNALRPGASLQVGTELSVPVGR